MEKRKEKSDYYVEYQTALDKVVELEETNEDLRKQIVKMKMDDNHKNYIDFEEYLKLQKEKEELEKEVERLQKVLYTITGSLDDGEPDLYEDC